MELSVENAASGSLSYQNALKHQQLELDGRLGIYDNVFRWDGLIIDSLTDRMFYGEVKRCKLPKKSKEDLSQS